MKTRKKQERTCCIVDFAALADHREIIKEQKERQVIGPCQRSKKAEEHEGSGDIHYNWNTWNGPQRLGMGGGLEESKIGESIETSQTTALLRSARILRKILWTNDGVKNT